MRVLGLSCEHLLKYSSFPLHFLVDRAQKRAMPGYWRHLTSDESRSVLVDAVAARGSSWNILTCSVLFILIAS